MLNSNSSCVDGHVSRSYKNNKMSTLHMVFLTWQHNILVISISLDQRWLHDGMILDIVPTNMHRSYCPLSQVHDVWLVDTKKWFRIEVYKNDYMTISTYLLINSPDHHIYRPQESGEPNQTGVSSPSLMATHIPHSGQHNRQKDGKCHWKGENKLVCHKLRRCDHIADANCQMVLPIEKNNLASQ